MLTLLLFGPGPGPFDRAVAAAEGGPTAPVHVAVQVDPLFLVEAVWPAVRAMPLAALPAGVARVPLTLAADQEAAFLVYLLARVGRERYSVRQLAVDAVGLTTHRWLPAPTRTCDCSGLVASGLVAVGALSTMPRPPDDVTPADLGAWCAAGQPRDLGALLAPPGRADGRG